MDRQPGGLCEDPVEMVFGAMDGIRHDYELEREQARLLEDVKALKQFREQFFGQYSVQLMGFWLDLWYLAFHWS